MARHKAGISSDPTIFCVAQIVIGMIQHMLGLDCAHVGAGKGLHATTHTVCSTANELEAMGTHVDRSLWAGDWR